MSKSEQSPETVSTDSNPHGDNRGNTDSNPHGDNHGNADSNLHGDDHGDTDSNPHGDNHGNAYSNPHGDNHGDTDSNPHGDNHDDAEVSHGFSHHGDNHGNADSNTHGDNHGNADSNPHGDNHGNADSNPHGDNHGNADSNPHGDNHDDAEVSHGSSHHGDHHGNRLLRFVSGDDESLPTSKTNVFFRSMKREEETEKEEELEDIRVAIKKEMIDESIGQLRKMNIELGEAYSRQMDKLKKHYEEKISICEENLTQCKQEMEIVRQRYEQNISEGDAHDSQAAKNTELDEAKKLLEKSRDAEHRAKLNLERVLQDNYLREEEILRLNRLLLQQEEKDELKIWTTKERFDECLVQTLEERESEIAKYKKKVEELELKIGELQTHGKDTKSVENISHDDLKALQLERSALKQTNEKYARLISDYVRMSIFLEQRTSAQLLFSSSSSSQTSSGFHPSPVSTQHSRGQLSDISVDEPASSAASTTDEGVEVSRIFADGLFSGSDFDAECEEAAKEASISIQRSFDRLLDAVGQSSTSHTDESQKLRELLQSAETTHRDLMEVCNALQDKLQKETSSVARLTEQLRIREEELHVIKKVSSEQSTEPKKRDVEKDELISSLYRTVEDLEHELNSTIQTTTDLRRRNQELEQIIKDFEEVREDEESMQTKFCEQLILISSLKSQLDEQKLVTNDYINDAKNISHWKDIMEQEKESSEVKDKRIDDLRKEVIELDEQIISNHVQLEKFRTEIEICKKQRIDIELQLNESHKKAVSELSVTLKEKETVVENLTTLLQSKQNELETLTKANSQLKHHYETETDHLRSQLEEKQSLLEIQIDEMSSLQSQLDRRDVKISQLTDELDSSEEDLAKLRRSFETERKKFSDLTLKMENDSQSLNRELNGEKGINLEKTTQLENLKRELEGKERELEELRKEKQEQLRRIDDLETDVAKLRARLDDSESEIEQTKEMLDEKHMQMRIQIEKIEELKRHHKKEVQDLLEDKDKELESLREAELEDLQRDNATESDELKTRIRSEFEHRIKSKEKEIADVDLLRGKEIEELQKNLKELKSCHAKELKALLKQKEKEVKELGEIHKRKLNDLCLEKGKELDAVRSMHLEELDEVEKSLESQRQRQLQKLKEKHREELNDMEDEIRSGQETIRRFEKQIAESTKQENVELNARHVKELSEFQRIKEIQEKEIQTIQSELTKSRKSVEELKRRIAEIETEKLEELRSLSDEQSRAVGELKLALEIRNDEKLQRVTEKHETALNELNREVTKLNTVSAELKRRISLGDNQRGKEHNEAEVRRTEELKELRLTFERQNDDQLRIIGKKHEQVVREMDEKLKKYEKEIEDLKRTTVVETDRQRDRVFREASVTQDREKDMLRSTLTKENQRRLEEISHRHRQEIESLQEELARSENSAKELENRYRRELREKVKEMNEAGTKHARELEALRTLMHSENEGQFNKLSEKYEQKFYGLRQELERNNSLMRESTEKESKGKRETKNLLNDATLRNSDDVIDDVKREHRQELHEEKMNQYQRDIRKLAEELREQQEAVRREKEYGEERLRELILKHSGEIRELKVIHQRYVDEVANNYRDEMSDLRRELCMNRDILKDLNVEHSRELAQLREELKHQDRAVHDNFPAVLESDAARFVGTQNQAVPPSPEAWKLERQCLLSEIAVFQNLLKEIGCDDDSRDSESMDWRTDILKAIHDVLTRQVTRMTVSEIYIPSISTSTSQELNTLLQTNMAQLEQFYSQGLAQILSVDRKSMLDEIDDLRQQNGSLQQVLLDDNKSLTDKLNGLELRYKKRQKRLKSQLIAAEAQLSKECEMRLELQATIDAERLCNEQLKDELKEEKDSAEQLKKTKISQMQLENDGSENALKEERIKPIRETFLSVQTITDPPYERFQNEYGYVIERLKLELLQEKDDHLQTKCDLAWERSQRDNLENRIKSHWERIGFTDIDHHLELILGIDLHRKNPILLDDFYYSMKREELILLQCEQLQRLVARYRDDLSKCSILSRDTVALDKELTSVCESLDSLVRNEDRMGNIGINLSSRLMALSERCRRAEEHRMSLVYQKRYLLLLIGGFQDNEQETVAAIARLGATIAPGTNGIHRYRHPMPLNRFRRAAQAAIAVIRIQRLAKRWGSFHGDTQKQMNLDSTWRTLSSGIGTGRENQSFNSWPSTSFDNSFPSAGRDHLSPPYHHRRSRSPTCRSRPASRTSPRRAFDDDVMTRCCDVGSETLSLVYSHYPPSPSRSSTKRRRWDESGGIRRQRLSKSPQSRDFISRKLPVRPASTYLW